MSKRYRETSPRPFPMKDRDRFPEEREMLRVCGRDAMPVCGGDAMHCVSAAGGGLLDLLNW